MELSGCGSFIYIGGIIVLHVCVYFSFRWGPFVHFPRDCTVELH